MTQPFNLQYFAEDPAPNVDPDGKNGEPGGEETIIFKSHAAFNARMQREAKKQMETQLKELGFDSVDQMKSLLSSIQAQEDAKKDALQKEKERADKAESDRLQTLENAHRILKEAAIQVQATTLKVKPQRLNTLMKLIDLSEIQITDSTVDETTVKNAVQTILSEIPEFLDKPTPKAGEDFSGGNADSNLTLDTIAKMSPAEINKHWEKVQATLKKQK